jgi:hypothetical protein
VHSPGLGFHPDTWDTEIEPVFTSKVRVKHAVPLTLVESLAGAALPSRLQSPKCTCMPRVSTFKVSY